MAASDSLRLTSLTLAPGAQWNVTCQVAAFPGTWLEVLKRAYHGRPGIGKDWSLPTRNLIELLIGLDPAVIHVSYKLGDEFITTQGKQAASSHTDRSAREASSRAARA